MKMRKLLAVLMSLAMLLTVFAATAETTGNDVADVFGKVEDNDYVNELIGLGFRLDDWHFCSDEEIDAMNTMTKAILAEDFSKLMDEVGNIYIMMAIASDRTNINISLNSLGEYAAAYKTVGMESITINSIDSTKSVLTMAGYKNVSVEHVKTPIEDQEYDGMLAKFELQNQAMLSRNIMLICDKYLVTITITGREEDKVNEAFKKLYHLN